MQLRPRPGRSRTSYVPGYFLALVHIGLRQHQQALDCLTLACRERCQHGLLLGLDPKLDPLKGYERFRELIASCALGEVATPRQPSHRRCRLPTGARMGFSNSETVIAACKLRPVTPVTSARDFSHCHLCTAKATMIEG